MSELERPTSNVAHDQTKASSSVTIKQTDTPSAEIEYLSWSYPPYCELCSVHFNHENNAKIHFDGSSHRNRLTIWQEYQNRKNQSDEDEDEGESRQKQMICTFCWKKMNTKKIFDDHCQSKAHLTQEKNFTSIQNLKEQYRNIRDLNF